MGTTPLTETTVAPVGGHPTHRGRPRARRSSRSPALLPLWDAACVLAALAVAGALVGPAGPWPGEPVQVLSWPAIATVAAAVALLRAARAYARRRPPLGHAPVAFGRLVLIAATASWAGVLTASLSGEPASVTALAAAAPIAAAGWLGGRLALARLYRRRPERVVIVGSGAVARRIGDIVARHPEHGLEVVALVDDDPRPGAEGIAPVAGGIEDLGAVLRTRAIDRVIVAFSRRRDEDIADVVRRCDAHGVEVDIVPRLFDLLDVEPNPQSLGGLSLLGVRAAEARPAAMGVKRAADVAGALVMLTLLAPVMAAIAVAIRLDSPGSVIFRQERIGRDMRPFRIRKFRSMYVDGDSRLQAAAMAAAIDEGASPDDLPSIQELAPAMKAGDDDPRVTRVGRFLRRTSLDELPQIWNVLVGDMSFVGPRPLRRYEVTALTGWQLTRQEVRPGITGLWQVLGRSDVGWDERMLMDYTYVRHWTLRSDVRVLARTLAVVVARRGAV